MRLVGGGLALGTLRGEGIAVRRRGGDLVVRLLSHEEALETELPEERRPLGTFLMGEELMGGSA